MRREEYLTDERVAGFTRWASQLVTGDLKLEHQWRTAARISVAPVSTAHWRTTAGQINRYGLDHRATARKLQKFRDAFRDIGVINSRAKQDQFVAKAEDVIRWGGIPLPAKLQEWRRMPPSKLQTLIKDTTTKLDPFTSDTNLLQGFRYMGSGFSKIYSVLIDGFPIYDSRVACALACLVRIYSGDREAGPKPYLLSLRIPPQRRPKSPRYLRCVRPGMYSNTAAYAEANMKAAWLLQDMIRTPGKFGECRGFHTDRSPASKHCSWSATPNCPTTHSPRRNKWVPGRPRHRDTTFA